MSKTLDKPLDTPSWTDLKIKSTLLGVPAWRLAEDLAVHRKDGTLVIKGLSENNVRI